MAVEQNITQREQVSSFIKDLPFHLKGTYHGNTPCIQIMNDSDDIIIFDAGTGIRELGKSILPILSPEKKIHIFISHLHWDHIQGFPFFDPIYINYCDINIYGCHNNLENNFREQQRFEHFPVTFDKLPAKINFFQIQPDQDVIIGDFSIKPHLVPHPGGSYSYRVEKNKQIFVYATDLEIKNFQENSLLKFYQFFQDAEYLIYDSMYTVPENIVKEDWGHSSAIIGVDLALKSNVKNLVLFHHEPTYSDIKIYELYESAMIYKNLHKKGNQLDLIIAYDGLELKL